MGREIFKKSEPLILGALGGFIATTVDEALITEGFIPFASMFFVLGIAALGFYEYREYKAQNPRSVSGSEK